MRTHLLIASLTATACAGGPSHRSLESVEQWSDRMVAQHGVERMSGLDPVDDWALLLWTQRSHEDPEGYPHHVPLFVHQQPTLDVVLARTIVEFEGDALFFCDLHELDPEAAAVITSGRHEVFLDQLTSIDAATARALVDGGTARLSLKGVTDLDPETAAILAELDGSLHLDGLTDPSLETVQALATWDAWGEQVILHLGVVEPTEAMIDALAQVDGWGLALDGVRDLSPERARWMGRIVRPQVSLNGLRTISNETAEVMSTWDAKFLDLDGLTSLSHANRELIEQGCDYASTRSYPRDP